jgi:hypothetical protein
MIHYLNDIVRCTNNDSDKLSDKVVVKVKTNRYESMIVDLRIAPNDMDDVMFNFKTRSEIKKIGLDCCADTQDCSICLNSVNKELPTVTKCGHHFCLTCIVENMRYNTTCPLCREAMDYKSIYTVVPTSVTTSKVSKLLSLLKDSTDKNIIYANSHKEAQYIAECMVKKRIPNVICTGRIQMKNRLITEFNDQPGPNNIIIQLSDHDISNSIKGITTIYFLNTTEITDIHNYCGYSYQHKEIDSMKIYQFKQIKN